MNTPSGPIVVTGTTGALGSSILKHLLTLTAAENIIVSLHNSDPAAAEELKAKGLTVRHATYSDPDSSKAAFAGGHTLLLMSKPTIDQTRYLGHFNAIDAAVSAGIKRIVYTSLAFGDGSVSVVMQPHLRTERYLRDTSAKAGFKYTIVREGLYTESYPLYCGFMKPNDTVVKIANDGPVSWVARDELGEATAKILLGACQDEEMVLLSNEEAITLTETVECVSEGKCKVEIVGNYEYEEVHKNMEVVGMGWWRTYDSIWGGECGQISGKLREILGRKPTGCRERLRQIVQDNVKPQDT